MAHTYAFVTLISSDSYLPGALAQVAALRDIHQPLSPPELPFTTVCLVTPETVDVSTVRRLRHAFDLVVGVEILQQDNPAALRLLGRPDLTTVLTKLHVFRLTQFSKIIFLDADVLPIRPLSHLFSLPFEFSAVPDVGWPDIFNSGVLVLTPGEDKFEELNQLVATKPSWDGGDQGLLNEWRGDNWHRLSFTYNTTPTAAYTYAPAYERYGSQIKAIHFIGTNKPWSSIPYRSPPQHPSDESPQPAYDYDSLVDRWFDVYDRHYNTVLPPQTPFEVARYTPAWERPSAQTPTTLDLDELKRLTIQGLNAFKEDSRPGEGAYKSLPLQGRVDLMRPRKSQPEKKEGEKEKGKEPVISLQIQPHDAFVPVTDDSDRLPSEPFNYDEVLTTPTARQAGFVDTDQSRWKTPGPEEVPSSPRLRLISLPPTPSPFAPIPSTAPDFYASESDSESFLLGHSDSAHEYRPDQHHKPHPHEHHHEHHHEHGEERAPPQQDHHHHEQHTPKRTMSPPIMPWNPAVEPPPNVPPTPNAFPTDTYFANVWDHTPSRQNDQAYSGPSQPDSGGFFQAPPPSVIPESLIKQGHYRDVTGDSPLGGNPSPDRSKLKTVFPWEDKPRVLPKRVFPDSDAPPPSLFLSPSSQSQTSTTTPSTPETRGPPTRNLPLSPLYGLPNALSYSNAWDNIPSIQKYASKLIKPPQPPQTVLAPAFEDDEYKKGRRKSWDERVEVSSRDGDDEDNADDEDEQPSKSRWDDDDSDREAAKRRSRRGSIVNPNVLKAKRKEYRSRGVQTVTIETRSQGVQVDPQPPTRSESKHVKKGSTSSRKHWAPTTASSVVAPTTTREVTAGGHGLPTTTPIARAPALGPENPKSRKKSPSVSPTYSPVRSPREFVVPPNSARPATVTATLSPPSKPTIRTSNNSSTSTLMPKAAPTPGLASAPPVAHPPLGLPTSRPPSTSRMSPSSIARRTSNDSSLGSPASSIGPLSPADSGHSLPIVRKGARVWDPARGVELFKRGSEEVLARFLKMGNWEDDNR